MKITNPPRTTNHEGNLRKQGFVFDLCYDGSMDTLVPYTMDCPVLDEVHTESHMVRTREHHISGFSSLDPRHIMHAEASCSAMIAASKAAVLGELGAKVAFAPVSGFHHAGHNFMGGFCTFNGLVAAAKACKDDMLVDTVLILDGDAHFGNGTADFLLMPEYSGWLRDWHIGGTPDGHENPTWLFWVERLEQVLKEGTVDLILYQAGADAHQDDIYQAGHLTTAQWMERDRLVFGLAKRWGVPIAWNLAGGYNGAQTLDLHTSTFESACMIYEPWRHCSIERGSKFINADGKYTEALTQNRHFSGRAGL